MENKTNEVRRIVSKEAEERLVSKILEEVINNKMTISNIKEAASKVINYLELNAVLEMEDSDIAKSSIHN